MMNSKKKQLRRQQQMAKGQFIEALKRISDICIEVAEDAPKKDLILIGTEAGLSDTELHEHFPELYESSEDDFSEEEGEENEEQQEEDNNEEEKQEE